MPDTPDRNHGSQPIASLLARHGLTPHDLVAASTEQLTHKQVTKACKGRRLTTNIQHKTLRALNAATSETYLLADLFTY